GQGAVEGGRFGRCPRIAAVIREGFVVVVRGRAQQHPQGAVGKLDDRGLGDAVLPADTSVGPGDGIGVYGFNLPDPPRVAVVVGKGHGRPVDAVVAVQVRGD